MRHFLAAFLSIIVISACSTGRQRREAQEARIHALMEQYKNCKTNEECEKAQRLFEMEMRMRDVQARQDKEKGKFWENAFRPTNNGPQVIQSTQIQTTEKEREPQSDLESDRKSNKASGDKVGQEKSNEEVLREMNKRIEDRENKTREEIRKKRQFPAEVETIP